METATDTFGFVITVELIDAFVPDDRRKAFRYSIQIKFDQDASFERQ